MACKKAKMEARQQSRQKRDVRREVPLDDPSGKVREEITGPAIPGERGYAWR
jgi:hypothetical protein